MANPCDEIQRSASFDGSLAIHIPKEFIEAVKTLVSLIRKPGPTPTPTPTRDPHFERVLREAMQNQMDYLMKKFEHVVSGVDSAIESSIRNESHGKRIEESILSLENTMSDVIKNTKESLSAEMKLQFEALMKEHTQSLSAEMKLQFEALMKDHKQLHDKSTIQKMEDILKDLETAQTFPGHLLHSYFQTGDHSGIHLVYSSDVTSKLCSLISGDGGVFSANVFELANFCQLNLKTNSENERSVVTGKLKFPGLLYGGLKGNISVPLPLNNIMGRVHYLHEYGGVKVSFQAGASPLVNLSCIFGVKAFSFGADVGFNPVLKELTKRDAAVRVSTGGVDLSLISLELNDTISASAVYKWQGYAAGLENSFTISNKFNKLFVGLSYLLDPATILKGRFGLKGRVSERNDELLESHAVAGVSVLRSWGTSSVGLSMELDLWKPNVPEAVQQVPNPRFGLFLKFGAAKKVSCSVKADAIPLKVEDFAQFV